MAKPKTPTTIRFHARLLRPLRPADAAWAFLLLPAEASAALPTRSQVSVEGLLAGQPFQATLDPDGRGGHWLKLEPALLAAAAVSVGDEVEVSMVALVQQPEPELPIDWAQALAELPAARATWDDITAVARRDWIQWISSGKKAETRAKRIVTACDMLASGKRRACCFDRSGIYSGAFSAPQAAK